MTSASPCPETFRPSVPACPADRAGPGGEEGEAAPMHRIRITLTSTKVGPSS